MQNIFENIDKNYTKNLPFVAFRKPNSNTLFAYFLANDYLHTTLSFKEEGFVFAPFDDEKESILFPKKEAKIYSEVINFEFDLPIKSYNNYNDSDKNKHTAIVTKAIQEIKNGKLEKVVISRCEKVNINNLDILTVYKRLLQTYSNAFVYVWFHPKVGLWLGATPETLLQTNNYSFKTMSLAGTQVYKDLEKVTWKSKELEEQQLVTNFIQNQLKEISTNLKIDKTKTTKAGNLLHLKTIVSGTLNTKSSIKELIRALHPTPAVCGLPRKMAKDFILNNENYQRNYYTGFLGEISQNSLDLFVNLRCMEIKNNNAFIYVGGGITKDSNALKEWQETVAKSATMGKVL